MSSFTLSFPLETREAVECRRLGPSPALPFFRREEQSREDDLPFPSFPSLPFPSMLARFHLFVCIVKYDAFRFHLREISLNWLYRSSRGTVIWRGRMYRQTGAVPLSFRPSFSSVSCFLNFSVRVNLAAFDFRSHSTLFLFVFVFARARKMPIT